MTKAATLTFGLAAVLLSSVALAQDNSAVTMAVNQSVLNQANTIVLRQKLSDARATEQRGDIVGAAKLYQEAVTLAQQIGPGIEAETAQAVAGLAATRMALARDAQSRGNYHEADVQVMQVLKADPKNTAAILFKQKNDQILATMKGRMPSTATLEQVPQVINQKTDAGTMTQDGKLLYEMGKLDEAEQKLTAALKLDPDNAGAYYYLNLIQQAKIARAAARHTVAIQQSMTEVEKAWVPTASNPTLPVPNPYATNDLVYTGAGRQAIIAKLNRIHLDNVSFDGLPLTEVVRYLNEQSKLRDPERKGINFLINPNMDQSGPAVAASGAAGFGAGVNGIGGGLVPGMGGGAGGMNGVGGAFGGMPGAAGAAGGAAALYGAGGGGAMDQTLAQQAQTTGGGGGEQFDVGSVQVKLTLNDVRLADVLDAIVLVADHPIKYSIQDFAVVFQAKGQESPVLSMRTFKVDPNTFYSGLESVGSQSFGSVQNNGSSGGGFGGGGNSSSGNNQNNGAVVGVVNAFAGAGGLRNYGNQGGGGGGGYQQGGNQEGGGGMGGGGLQYVTQVTSAATPSEIARAFFTALGVNLQSPPGKSVFFNDRLGLLFVKATQDDLDTIERAIEILNKVPPEVHIKSRFIEVQQKDDKSLGFDWYLGQFNLGNQAVAQGGNPGSLTVPTSAANPIGAFPGATLANVIPDGGQNLFNSGLVPGSGATTATITGILTDPNFQLVLHALQTRSGVENLGEPEAVTTSGRQTQMRATHVITVITGTSTQQGTSAANISGANTTGQ